MANEKEEKEEKQEMPTLDELEPIELPEFDLTPYVGRKVKIVSANIVETKFGCAVVFASEDLDNFKKQDGTLVRVNASKLVGIQKDANGKWGWGPDTKLGKFLKAMKATTPRQCIGKTAIVQMTDSNANGKRFLTLS